MEVCEATGGRDGARRLGRMALLGHADTGGQGPVSVLDLTIGVDLCARLELPSRQHAVHVVGMWCMRWNAQKTLAGRETQPPTSVGGCKRPAAILGGRGHGCRWCGGRQHHSVGVVRGHKPAREGRDQLGGTRQHCAVLRLDLQSRAAPPRRSRVP